MDKTQSRHETILGMIVYSSMNARIDAEQGQNQSSDNDLVVNTNDRVVQSVTEQPVGDNRMRSFDSEDIVPLSTLAGLVSKMIEDAIEQGNLSMNCQSLHPMDEVTTAVKRISEQQV